MSPRMATRHARMRAPQKQKAPCSLFTFRPREGPEKAAGLGQTAAQPRATARRKAVRQQATEPGTLVTGQIPATTIAPRDRSLGLAAQSAAQGSQRPASVGVVRSTHDARAGRCRHEWRDGTQECARHKRKRPRVRCSPFVRARGQKRPQVWTKRPPSPSLRDSLALAAQLRSSQRYP